MPTQNRLADESSPYLLQHASNPVDWWPWGDEAFAEARRRDVPVLVSVGYSACHWCHVMAHESFEDGEVASVLNSGFVPVKVDREERPDVDAVYMEAVQLVNGSGGWPMTVLTTPDRRPFWAGTYLPKASFLRLLGEVRRLWAAERAAVEDDAARLSAASIDVLALVAYRQPTTKQEIDTLRGTDCGSLLRQLVRRGLVAVLHRGDADRREVTYGTTARFLELFKLRSLDDLPQTQDLQRL